MTCPMNRRASQVRKGWILLKLFYLSNQRQNKNVDVRIVVKRSARFKSPQFKCGPPAVEPRYIASPSSSSTACESDFTDNFFLTSSKEGGVIDFNDSIDSVVATDSTSDYNAESNIDPISFSKKFGVKTSILSITVSTLVSTLHTFLARKPFKCSIQNYRRMVLDEFSIPALPTHYFNALD